MPTPSQPASNISQSTAPFSPGPLSLAPGPFLMVRTRFAPSPTGYLHIGGVRTALFCWLFARRHGGQFLLRIDDTDAERNVEAALAPILHGFRWLGIDWDEGPEVGGPHAPYYQSQRLPRYQAAVEKLLAAGVAYRDYATTEEMQAEREAAQREKRPFLYSRRLMAETPAQQKEFEGQGRQAGRAAQDAARGNAPFARPHSRRRRFRMGARAGPRHPADRRHVPVSSGQRGRRLRFRNHARHSGRRASVEHAAAGVHRPVARLSAARVCPSAVRRRAGQQQQAQQAKARQVSEEPRFRADQRAWLADRRGAGAGHFGRDIQSGDRRFLRASRLSARGDSQLPVAVGLVVGRQARVFHARRDDRQLFARARHPSAGQLRSQKAVGLSGPLHAGSCRPIKSWR